MKFIIVSDIHGNELSLKKVVNFYNSDNFDGIIILGDILYHGPRNPVTEGYNPLGVVEILNELKDKIIAVRGNCDAEVDQALLKFPCMSDYAILNDNGRTLFATHGHLWNPGTLPNISENSIFLYGHTHIHEIYKKGNLLICNPGSITLPKNGNNPTFAVYDNGDIKLIDITLL